MRIGRMTLNRNPDNFFAETEQAAFHVGHIVPGIDFTNDPLMQGRLFSYTDTQLIRHGGPNFHEIPINRPVVPVHNNQRDGHMRQTINRGKASYSPNTLGGGCPYQAMMREGGFVSYPEKIDAHKIRERSRSFMDHYSQAKLFFNSQSEPEKQHIIDALSFELGKVQTIAIRERMLSTLAQVDMGLATEVAYNLRLHVSKIPPANMGLPADGDSAHYASIIAEPSIDMAPSLSMANSRKDTIETRCIAILAADGVDSNSLNAAKQALVAAGATAEVIAPRQNYVLAQDDTQIPVDKSFLTAASVFYDAVYVPGGTNSVAELEACPEAIHFLNEAFKHCKAIAADKEAMQVLQATYFSRRIPEVFDEQTVLREGVVVSDHGAGLAPLFIKAIAQHRFWEREKPRKVPA
jgi:catalase